MRGFFLDTWCWLLDIALGIGRGDFRNKADNEWNEKENPRRVILYSVGFLFVSVIISLVHEVAKTNNKGDIEKPKPSVKEKFKHGITFVLLLIGLCIYRPSRSSFSSNIAEKLSVYSFIMSNEPMIS